MPRQKKTPEGQARKSLWIETLLICLWWCCLLGQARKSLWIETSSRQNSSDFQLVRLVRACGSKLIESAFGVAFVRLVRACGSKRYQPRFHSGIIQGQARKSLWIETGLNYNIFDTPLGQARKSLWIETLINSNWFTVDFGQARKSLWIETAAILATAATPVMGQARKSLWIET